MYSNQIYRLMIIAIVLCGCLLSGCSGGGGDNGNATVTTSAGIAVSGRVSANIVYPGTVKIYGVNADGTLKTPALVTGQTEIDGSYSVSLTGYQGAIVGIAFGRYTDEATKVVIDIPEDKCLYAALQDADVRGKSAVTLHISPLSDLAYRLARTTTISSLFLNNIAASNLAISQLFGVDFTATPAVSFNAATLADSSNTSDQVRLATLLAALSQFTVNGSATPLVTTAGDMQAALSRLATGITVSGGIVRISPEIAYLLQQAGLDLLSNVLTNTIVAAGGSAAQSMLSTLAGLGSGSGTKMARFRLRTTTTSYSGNLYGITVTVGIPAGFVLSTDSSGLAQPGVVVASGQAPINSSTYGNVAVSVLTVGIGEPINGFGIGEFVTVYGEIPAASSPPLAGAFPPVTFIQTSDAAGKPIPGIGVEVF